MVNIIKSKMTGYAHMIAILRSLEAEMGLDTLTPLERSILAVMSLDEFKGGVSSEVVFAHEILDAPTQSSFYRALKRLRNRGLIDTISGRKTGIYRTTL